ncbi:MAG: TAXI family TRAP transporter solute-binding subunit [Syntrophobacteraceae bacterium]
MKKFRVSTSGILALTLMLAVVLVSGQALAQKNISISTGATSGTYYPLGTAIGKTLTQAGIVNATTESTGGSVENARLIGQKQTEIGFVESMIADWAYNGKEVYQGKKIENICGLIALYPNTMQTVVKANSGIKSYKDLKGKTVAVGIQGSSSPTNMQIVLESYGLSMSDIKPQYLAFGPSMELLKDGQVDAVMVDSGAPNSAIIDISTQHQIRILPVDAENIQKIKGKYPFFSDAHIVPKGTYKGVDEDVVTTGSLVTLCVQKDLPEDLVYNITKTMIEKRDEIAKVHDKGKSINLQTATNGISIPIHPGAAKYYKEKGVMK